MKLLDKPCVVLPEDIDEECVELCNLLNRLPGVETRESCCGHCKQHYMIFFKCSDLRTLTRLGRALDRRYSDGIFEIVLDTCDFHPKNCFWLRSRVVFETNFIMKTSVKSLITNIGYWFSDEFDNYFDTDNGHDTSSLVCENKSDWTTIEEAQLVERLGISPETADASWVDVGDRGWIWVPYNIGNIKNSVPCWTLDNLKKLLKNE